MTACKYWDCGWCYAPNYLKTNSINSACVDPYKCPISPLSEPVQYETPMTEIEKVKAQIKVLEKKLSLLKDLKELEKTNTKPRTLYDVIADWWDDTFTKKETSLQELVDRIEEWLPKEHETNSYKWNECIRMIRENLR